MQVRAKDVIDILEAQTLGGKAVEPRLLRKIHWRRVAFVLAGAGVDQDGVFGGAHHKGLVRDHHLARCRIEHLRVHFSEMAAADLWIVFREHFLRRAPRPVPFDDAGDGHIADRKLVHSLSLLVDGVPSQLPSQLQSQLDPHCGSPASLPRITIVVQRGSALSAGVCERRGRDAGCTDLPRHDLPMALRSHGPHDDPSQAGRELCYSFIGHS